MLPKTDLQPVRIKDTEPSANMMCNTDVKPVRIKDTELSANMMHEIDVKPIKKKDSEISAHMMQDTDIQVIRIHNEEIPAKINDDKDIQPSRVQCEDISETDSETDTETDTEPYPMQDKDTHLFTEQDLDLEYFNFWGINNVQITINEDNERLVMSCIVPSVSENAANISFLKQSETVHESESGIICESGAVTYPGTELNYKDAFNNKDGFPKADFENREVSQTRYFRGLSEVKEPGVKTEPIVVTEPTSVIEHVAMTDPGPTAITDPVIVIEPITIKEAVVAINPISVTKPLAVTKPISMIEPMTVIKPVIEIKPTAVIEPVDVIKPTAVLEPIAVMKPTAVIEPVALLSLVDMIETAPVIKPSPQNKIFIFEPRTISKPRALVQSQSVINSRNLSLAKTIMEPEIPIPLSDSLKTSSTVNLDGFNDCIADNKSVGEDEGKSQNEPYEPKASAVTESKAVIEPKVVNGTSNEIEVNISRDSKALDNPNFLIESNTRNEVNSLNDNGTVIKLNTVLHPQVFSDLTPEYNTVQIKDHDVAIHPCLQSETEYVSKPELEPSESAGCINEPVLLSDPTLETNILSLSKKKIINDCQVECVTSRIEPFCKGEIRTFSKSKLLNPMHNLSVTANVMDSKFNDSMTNKSPSKISPEEPIEEEILVSEHKGKENITPATAKDTNSDTESETDSDTDSETEMDNVESIIPVKCTNLQRTANSVALSKPVKDVEPVCIDLTDDAIECEEYRRGNCRRSYCKFLHKPTRTSRIIPRPSMSTGFRKKKTVIDDDVILILP